MKNKILRTILFILMMVLIIFGISNLAVNIVEAVEGSNISRASAKPGVLAKGEKDPNTTSYNTNFGTWEYENYTFNRYPYSKGDGSTGNIRVPSKGGYQVYCIQPDAHVMYSWDITYSEYYSQMGQASPLEGDCYQAANPGHDEQFILEEKYKGGKGGYTAHNVDAYGKEITSDWNEGCNYNGNAGNHYWTPVKWTPLGTINLSPAAAYIVSEPRIMDCSKARCTLEPSRYKLSWRFSCRQIK